MTSALNWYNVTNQSAFDTIVKGVVVPKGSASAIAMQLTNDEAVSLKSKGYLVAISVFGPGLNPGEEHLGSISGNTAIIDTILTTDTSIYADGDVLADTQVLSNVMRGIDKPGILQSVRVLDEADQGVGFDLFFLSSNGPFGTENAVPTLSDANAIRILGWVEVVAGDYKDLGGCRVAQKTNIGLGVRPHPGTKDLYIAAIVRGGTPTYAADSIKLRITFLLD